MTAPQLTPPPPTGIGILDRWLALLWRKLTAGGELLWSQVSKAGSNLTDIETRNHADLQNLNTASYTHLTAANHTDLTDGGDSTLHFHATDRARSNHTGTQVLTTISDVTITAANLNTLDDGVNTALHFHDSDRARANHTGTQVSSTISDFTEAAQDAVGVAGADTASVNFTYDDTSGAFTWDVIPGGVSHNALASLQGGTTNEYYHLTSAEYTGTGTGVFVRKDSPTFTVSGAGAFGLSGATTGVLSSGVANVALLADLTVNASLPVVFNWVARPVASGINTSRGHQYATVHAPIGASLTNAQNFLGTQVINGAVPITNSNVFNAAFQFDAAATATVTTHAAYQTNTPNMNGSAGIITNYIHFDAVNVTSSHTLTASFRGQMTSGSGKWNAYMNGSADNAFAGPTRFGSVVAPTKTADITGTLGVSGAASLDGPSNVRTQRLRSSVDTTAVTYASKSLSVTAFENNPGGLFFRPDGRVVFYAGLQGDDVNQAALTTAWDISTGGTPTTFSLGAGANPHDLWFNATGTKLLYCNDTTSVSVRTLTTGWSVATAGAATTQDLASKGLVETTLQGITLSPDGLNLYVCGPASDLVERFTLASAYDPTTATRVGQLAITNLGPSSLVFSICGSQLFVLTGSGTIRRYDMTTPWDITTATLISTSASLAQGGETQHRGMYIRPDFSALYLLGNTNDTIYQYTITKNSLCVAGDWEMAGDITHQGEFTQRGGDLGIDSYKGLAVRPPGAAANAYGWRDILCWVHPKTSGAGTPTRIAYAGANIGQFHFVANDICDFEFHIPHDYVLGTDIYVHVHWSHNGTAITGNAVFDLYHTYSKGHNQQNFPAEKLVTITYATTDIATTPQYRHRIDEIIMSAGTATATLMDRDDIEPDGLVLMTLHLNTLPTITGGDLFIHHVDLHYQSNGMATFNKAPNFYE